MGKIYEVRHWDGLRCQDMPYIPSFIKSGSGIQKLIGRDTQTHQQDADRMSLLSFFQSKESRLKTEYVHEALMSVVKV
jgi:hypothetical protein